MDCGLCQFWSIIFLALKQKKSFIILLRKKLWLFKNGTNRDACQFSFNNWWSKYRQEILFEYRFFPDLKPWRYDTPKSTQPLICWLRSLNIYFKSVCKRECKYWSERNVSTNHTHNPRRLALWRRKGLQHLPRPSLLIYGEKLEGQNKDRKLMGRYQGPTLTYAANSTFPSGLTNASFPQIQAPTQYISTGRQKIWRTLSIILFIYLFIFWTSNSKSLLSSIK